jgi:Rps23 Pro-64 3,4-dihydroxylase Tpa1-like proline 4-hydroxylase
MHRSELLHLAPLQQVDLPFPHAAGAGILPIDFARALHTWLLETDRWHLTTADFYDQYEFSLLDAPLPADLAALLAPGTLDAAVQELCRVFTQPALRLVDVTAHRLVDGQRIALHDDYLGPEETHRLVLHLSPDWQDAHGGYLMLFSSADATHVSHVVRPAFNTGFAFEISPQSHHAVSQIHGLDRYSVVFTFQAYMP